MYALSFGGPGSGIKGHQPLYHGTSSDVLDKILKEGVRPKSASPHGGSDVAYATSNFGQAQLHAHIKAQERGAKPVVVELHGTAGTAGTTAGFKPEHIKAVHELDSDGKMKRRLLSETTMKQVEGFYFLADLSRRFADAVDGKSSPYVQGKWFQLAKTGTFYSPHYGKVEVSPQMLSTMVKNFKTITPLAPTQLPIDYDHLSDDPQKPGDGRAAGWVEDLRLSPDGQRLEFLPKWTKPAAEMIAKGEYRFVSPFFLTQYMDKRSGKKVGPTLKAVAITNRPFLEGMQEIPAPAIAASERIARQFSTDRRMAVAVRKRHVLAVINAHGRRMAMPDVEDETQLEEMKDDTPPEPGLTCPHCGAPVKHLAEAPKPEEEEEDMGDMPPPKKPMGDMKDTMPPKKLEGEEHVGPVEDMDSDVDADGDADGDTQDEIDKPKGNHPPPVAAAERTVSKRERALSERVKQLEAKSADYERMLRSVQKSQRREMANKLLSEGTRTGKLTPRMIGTAAQPGWAMSEAYRNPNRFSKWLKSAPRVVEFGERGTSAEDAADGAAGTAQKIEQLVQVKMAEQKALKYADAVKLVLSENRPLAEAYDREMIGERQPASAARSNVRRL